MNRYSIRRFLAKIVWANEHEGTWTQTIRFLFVAESRYVGFGSVNLETAWLCAAPSERRA